MGFVRDALDRRRVPGYLFARAVSSRMESAGEGSMSEHRFNKLMCGRVQSILPSEIRHMSDALLDLGEKGATPDVVEADLERARKEELEHLGRTA